MWGDDCEGTGRRGGCARDLCADLKTCHKTAVDLKAGLQTAAQSARARVRRTVSDARPYCVVVYTQQASFAAQIASLFGSTRMMLPGCLLSPRLPGNAHAHHFLLPLPPLGLLLFLITCQLLT